MGYTLYQQILEGHLIWSRVLIAFYGPVLGTWLYFWTAQMLYRVEA